MISKHANYVQGVDRVGSVPSTAVVMKDFFLL